MIVALVQSKNYPLPTPYCTTKLGYSHHTLVWHATLTLGFFGDYGGGGECTMVPSPAWPLSPWLLISHISLGMIKDLSFMSVTTPRSKTKPHAFQISIGCSGTANCAVCSMHSYLHYCASLSPIPPNINMFVLPNGSPLLKSVLNQKIKCLVSSIDLGPSRYSTHSMRTGVATTAAVAGFNEIQVKCIGGWSSQAYTLYIREIQTEQITYAKQTKLTFKLGLPAHKLTGMGLCLIYVININLQVTRINLQVISTCNKVFSPYFLLLFCLL